MIRIVWRNMAMIQKDFDAIDARIRKAYQSAAKGAGFQLRGTMIREVKKGTPGGQRFSPLSYLRRYASGRLRANRPYVMPHGLQGGGGAKMADLIRYNAEAVKDGMRVSVGWTDTQREKLSRSYKRLAAALQKGFTSRVTDARRAFFARMGASMSGRSRTRKYFFLKKSTTRLKTPGREVIEPFARVHGPSAGAVVREMFKNKMAGGTY